MKLIYCPLCQDVVRLVVSKQRFCECCASYGQYKEDGLNATIGGSAIPIGFSNLSFSVALNVRDSSRSVEFEAFVIPTICKTVTVDEEN